MIKLFQPVTFAQIAKHYSTIRESIGVVVKDEPTIEADFCSCIMQCIPCLPLLTDEVGSDQYKNDFFTVYQNTPTGGSHTLHIVVDDEEVEITDSTYGVEYNGEVFYGYRFDAYKIWQEHGYGRYSAIMRAYDSTSNLIKTTESPCYQLDKYGDRTANRTVRIETRQKGKLLHGNNYTDLRLQGSPKPLAFWRQQIRLPGMLKPPKFVTENDRLTLNDDLRSSLQVMDRMVLEYDLILERLSEDQALPVILDYLFANTVYVSDYNVYNWGKYRNVRLIKQEVDNSSRVARRNTLTIKMRREEDNIEKTND
jgi:hypothetical protein